MKVVELFFALGDEATASACKLPCEADGAAVGMHQDRSATLAICMRAAKRKTPRAVKGKPRGNDLPSAHLSDDAWCSIGDSMGMSFRQLQVVRGIFDGSDEPSIGRELGVSAHTVHAHINRLYKKVCVKSRSELVVRVFMAYLARAPARGARTRKRTARPSTALKFKTTRTRQKRRPARKTAGRAKGVG